MKVKCVCQRTLPTEIFLTKNSTFLQKEGAGDNVAWKLFYHNGIWRMEYYTLYKNIQNNLLKITADEGQHAIL